MSVQMTISDQQIVCRTCLKILENTGYTYLDDENGYITNVGNIREMLQFCIPELDLHVSADPIICSQCLPILVQVYNFKIKCVNGESMIRSYMARNNLQDYNHVNLNCVVMEELIQNQKAQIENRIKHFMVQETAHNNNRSNDDLVDTTTPKDNPVIKIENSTFDNDQNYENISENNINEELEYSVNGLMKFECDTSLVNESKTSVSDEQNQINNIMINSEKHKNIVVRKDLFDMSKSKKKKATMLNNSVVTKNGRIIIKIDRRRLQSFKGNHDVPSTDSFSQEIDDNQTSLVKRKKQKPKEVVKNESDDSEDDVSEKDKSPQTYNCDKCSFITNDMIKMYDHNRTFHNLDYTCQHCPFSTSKVELLGKHMTMVHPKDMAKQRSFKITQNFACTLCPFSVKSVELLRSHHLSAHGNQVLSNDTNDPIILNTAFNDKNEITNEPKILRRTEYVCDVCSYSTKDKSNLRKHLFTHGTKPLTCNFCSYKCVSPYQLRRHLKLKHPSMCNLRTRSAPYQLPTYGDADEYKITLDTLKSELDSESLL